MLYFLIATFASASTSGAAPGVVFDTLQDLPDSL